MNFSKETEKYRKEILKLKKRREGGIFKKIFDNQVAYTIIGLVVVSAPVLFFVILCSLYTKKVDELVNNGIIPAIIVVATIIVGIICNKMGWYKNANNNSNSEHIDIGDDTSHMFSFKSNHNYDDEPSSLSFPTSSSFSYKYAFYDDE